MRTTHIIAAAILLFSLLTGCKKNKNSDDKTKEPVCNITRYQDSLVTGGFVISDIRMQYSDDKMVIYTKERKKHFIYYSTTNIVMKTIDTIAPSVVRTDSMTLDSRGLITAKYITFNDSNMIGYPAFFLYDAAGQLIRMTGSYGSNRDTTLYEWANGDVVKQITDDTIIFSYDKNRLASDGDPWLLSQKLDYGAPLPGSKHLRQSLEFRGSTGVGYQHYEYSYKGRYITGAKFIETTADTSILRNVIMYEYTCH